MGGGYAPGFGPVSYTHLDVYKRQAVEGKTGRTAHVAAVGQVDDGAVALCADKTYTAIALAVRALKNKEIKKIILSRPAVEAGEKLGFLPGDMKDKIEDVYKRQL